MNHNHTKIFISHASVDAFEGGLLHNSLHKVKNALIRSFATSNLDENLKEKLIFFSSIPRNGLEAGDRIFDTITDKILNAEIFIAIISDNYLRSPYCIYELCLSKMRKEALKKIIIYANDDIKAKTPPLVDSDILNIVATDAKAAEQLSNSFKGTHAYDFQDYLDFLKQRQVCHKPYLGQDKDEYSNILTTCNHYGIQKIKQKDLYSTDELKDHIINAEQVYFVSTTGSGLLKNLKENLLPEALAKGVIFNIITPDLDSIFCHDVAIAECLAFENNEIITEQNIQRIKAEFAASHQYLNEAVLTTKQKWGAVSGEIRYYDAHTLLRQTILLTRDKQGNMWGWVSMTMPPIRSVDSPAMLFSHDTATSKDKQIKSLATVILEHCQALIKVAGEPRILTGITSALAFPKSDREKDVRTAWELKREEAIRNIKRIQYDASFSGTLIEVAAQHPLIDGMKPNQEFSARLDEAIRLYHLFKENGTVKIYVPGSRHSFIDQDGNRTNDKISLSEAGKIYLIQKGIPQTDIFAEEMNNKYMGSNGVYNSLDECYVSSQIFRDYRFREMICVCSPIQVMRKTFAYIQFSIIPKCYSVPSDNMYHDPVSEYFSSLESVVYGDCDWQNPESEVYQQSRASRLPK